MLQILQHQRTGDLKVMQVPAPLCRKNGVLVKTINSLISAGTERASFESTKLSLFQRAKKHPEQVKMLMEYFKKEGLRATINKVKTKLDSYKVFGYSASGIVIESRSDRFKPGDRVACAGAGIAMHSEILSVPQNLAAKIPDNVDFESSAYTTVGTIALQGIRQAEPKIGEWIAVIGLGLIGLITVQILKANGCNVVGLDIKKENFELAEKCGCNICFPSQKSAKDDILSQTNGLGCDAVIITASSKSNEPVELAMEICRKKGKIVIVGDIAMNLPRSPFYEKELDIRISCSYGPGRYDSQYELAGIDYPPAYVRWTENRNMLAFLELLSQGKINTSILTTHRFDIKDAVRAYDLISGKTNEKYLGIILDYDKNIPEVERKIVIKELTAPKEQVKIGLIGAGSFAQSVILPALVNTQSVLVGVSSENPAELVAIGNRWNFSYVTSDSMDLINDSEINTIICTAPHEFHSFYVIEALKVGKPIFVEKPLCVSEKQLQEIEDALAQYGGQVMVGFNRRFSNSFEIIKEHFSKCSEPFVMHYRVSAGRLSKEHWIYNEANKGRIIGEVCHFIDTMVFLTDSEPQLISAFAISGKNIELVNEDNVVINIKFNNGSIGSVLYTSQGAKSVDKEYFEAFRGTKSAKMHNFQRIELFDGNSQKTIKSTGEKGHSNELNIFIQAVRDGKTMPIPFEQIKAVTKATFAIHKSLQCNEIIEIK